MNNLLVKEFNGSEIHTFMWNGKPCWIANEIVSLFGYADSSKTIQQCIEAEEFETGIEYDVLVKEDLKKFKKMASELTTVTVVSKNTPSLIIFYEDGLYGFLQYTDKPVGVKFRKWIRSEVLPTIRKEGAYITSSADPEKLRAKANEIESITALNEAARIMLPVLEEAGLKPQYKALTLKQIYRRAGIELPIEEIRAERELFDLTSIAKTVGIFSKNAKPHGQAVGAIITQLDIAVDEKELVSFERRGHMGTTYQYTKTVVDKVSHWLSTHGHPKEIALNGKTYKVNYGEVLA